MYFIKKIIGANFFGRRTLLAVFGKVFGAFVQYRMLPCLIWGTWAVLLILPLTQTIRWGNPYPYSDEFALIPYAIGENPVSASWLWQQHTDHRIPLPKALWVATLRISNLDFRFCVLLNILLLGATAAFMLFTLRRLRHHYSIWDLSLLFLFFNLGFLLFRWGFSLPFLSSTLLLCSTGCALMLAFSSDKSMQAKWLLLASVSMVAQPLCGMNGLVSGVIMALAVIFLYIKKSIALANRGVLVLLIAACLTCLVSIMILLQYKPSGAFNYTALSLGGFFSYFLRLLASPLLVWYPDKLPFKLILISFLLGGAGLVIVKNWKFTNDQSDRCRVQIYVMAAIILSCLANAIAIAFGRSAAIPWSHGLETHYGFLMVPMFVFSWWLISAYLGNPLKPVAGALLLTVTLLSYKSHLDGLSIFVINNFEHQILAVTRDILNHTSINTLVERHIRFFFYVDNEQARAFVKAGLEALSTQQSTIYANLASPWRY